MTHANCTTHQWCIANRTTNAAPIAAFSLALLAPIPPFRGWLSHFHSNMPATARPFLIISAKTLTFIHSKHAHSFLRALAALHHFHSLHCTPNDTRALVRKHTHLHTLSPARGSRSHAFARMRSHSRMLSVASALASTRFLTQTYSHVHSRSWRCLSVISSRLFPKNTRQ